MLRRADGRLEKLQALDQFSVGPGDTLIIETPGGGGFGIPEREEAQSKA
jgi:5-oxoprolinase (ATP-hydrolysing)